jgi:hypothetical protein
MQDRQDATLMLRCFQQLHILRQQVVQLHLQMQELPGLESNSRIEELPQPRLSPVR